jgi:hypothetical protein
LELQPNPPQIGTPIELIANGTATRAVAGGNLSINALYYGGQVFSQTVDLCGVDNVPLPLGSGTVVIYALECPVTSGSKVSVSANIPLPEIAPSGQYEITLNGAGGAGSPVLCLDLKANIQG